MTENRRTLQRRLGEIRSLPADRQNAAILDLLQQTLDESSSLQDYLVAARTGITGDVALDPNFTTEPLGSGQSGRDLNDAASRRQGRDDAAPENTPREPSPSDTGTGDTGGSDANQNPAPAGTTPTPR